MKRASIYAPIIALTLAALFPCTLYAAGDADFPPRRTVGPNELQLYSTGTFTYLRVFHLLDGALYLQPHAEARDALANEPKRIEFVYRRDLPLDSFVKAGERALRSNLSPELLSEMQDGIRAMNKLYVDVKKGDRQALSYIPGVGMTLEHNGAVLGTVEGEAFGTHYFSIWLGEEPASRRLKDELFEPVPNHSPPR